MADRPGFFAAPPEGELGLAVFLNAGDPPLEVLPDVITMLDESRVDVLELAVPFPDSFTDGPVVRRSAGRALDRGAGLSEVLACVSSVSTRHLRIALLADWSHTVRPFKTPPDFLSRVRDSGADALLTHGLPAVLRDSYYHAAHEAQVPVVSTCYPGSSPEVLAESARNATAYLYLVAHYGRSGAPPPGEGFTRLRPLIPRLRANTTAPIAAGFGVRGRAEIEQLRQVGADAAVIGSAAVAVVEQATTSRRDVIADLARFIVELRAPQLMYTAKEGAST